MGSMVSKIEKNLSPTSESFEFRMILLANTSLAKMKVRSLRSFSRIFKFSAKAIILQFSVAGKYQDNR